MSQTDEYIKLMRKAHFKIEELETSSGFQISNEIKGLKASVYIYKENFKELEVILNQFDDVDYVVELISERYSKKRDAKISEFLRAFHNFIISVKSLVDHVRNFMRSYSSTTLGDKYQQKIKNKFINNDEVKFLEELRNYFCHYRLPELNPKITVDYEQNFESSSINLSKDDLLKYDGWNRAAKRYISKCSQEIDINDIIYRYKMETDGLYDWLFSELKEIHSSELETMDKLMKEYDKLGEEMSKISPFKS